VAVFYLITVHERLKHEVLNLFNLLTPDTLLDSYSECDDHLRLLGDCSLLRMLEEDGE